MGPPPHRGGGLLPGLCVNRGDKGEWCEPSPWVKLGVKSKCGIKSAAS